MKINTRRVFNYAEDPPPPSAQLPVPHLLTFLNNRVCNSANESAPSVREKLGPLRVSSSQRRDILYIEEASTTTCDSNTSSHTMSDGDTYAPQSPDLSAYHATPVASHPPVYEYPQHQEQPQHPQYQSSYQPPTYNSIPLPSYQTNYPSHPAGNYPPTTMARRQRSDMEVDDEWGPAAPPAPNSGRRSKKPKVEESFGKPAPGVEEGVEVKTKFPVARIKRIMQADEDVGKVAQVTPTAVCGSLIIRCGCNLPCSDS